MLAALALLLPASEAVRSAEAARRLPSRGLAQRLVVSSLQGRDHRDSP